MKTQISQTETGSWKVTDENGKLLRSFPNKERAEEFAKNPVIEESKVRKTRTRKNINYKFAVKMF